MNTPASTSLLAFIGGGNMASAIIGGLLRQGTPLTQLMVVEPHPPQREKLRADFGLIAMPQATPDLARAATVLWAVKPQSFAEAAAACAGHLQGALQLSIMAGIRSAAISAATGSARVVRAMPNTPALIGQGVAGLFANAAVTAEERAQVAQVLAPTGELLWVDQEDDLDAVTALSGSGPAYVFYFIEAMCQAATEMGLTQAQGRTLAQQTFAGAAALAAQSSESPALLRERVTSKGGTTYAALQSLEHSGVKAAFVAALHAARARAQELGR